MFFTLAHQVRNTISTLYYLSSYFSITGSDEGKSAEESQGSWNPEPYIFSIIYQICLICCLWLVFCQPPAILSHESSFPALRIYCCSSCFLVWFTFRKLHGFCLEFIDVVRSFCPTGFISCESNSENLNMRYSYEVRNLVTSGTLSWKI